MIDSRTLKIGDQATLSKTISVEDIVQFADITGDDNPVHLNDEYAAASPFGGRVAHGILVAGLISAVLGTKLPGPGAIYLGQTLSFLAPVSPGDNITATVEVIEIGAKRKSARLKTTCTNQKGTTVIEGEATVLLPRQRKKSTT